MQVNVIVNSQQNSEKTTRNSKPNSGKTLGVVFMVRAGNSRPGLKFIGADPPL